MSFLENLKARAVSVNATKLEESLLKFNPNLKATSRKKEVFISFKDDLAAALECFQEHSLQNHAIHLSRAAHIIHFNTVRQKENSEASRHTSAKETSLSIYVAFLLHSQTQVVCLQTSSMI